MIPQTDRRCKHFLGKKRPGREKAHGVSSRPGVRTARPVQTPSGKLSAVVWAAGAGFMQGAENVQGAVLWGAPQGRRRRRRAQPAGARAAGPLRGVGAGALWWGRMVRGGRPAGAPAEGRGRGRPGAAPTPPQAAARWAVGAGEMLGRGWGGCGAHPASTERRMVIAGVVRRPPGHGRCRRWPAGFWCAGGGHWGPCPAHRGPLPPHGRPSWKGS